tara:strand:- start:1305 stop:2177 length:873 start_codon:yes stop_codon:yes gene_type:complete
MQLTSTRSSAIRRPRRRRRAAAGSSYVTDGLQWHIDPKTSYSGSGTSLLDLTSNDIDFTMVSSPSYNSTEGSFTFDGTDDMFHSDPEDWGTIVHHKYRGTAAEEKSSFEFWVKMPNTSSNVNMRIVSKGFPNKFNTANTNNSNIVITVKKSTFQMRLWVKKRYGGVSHATASYLSDTNFLISNNAWTHVVLTIDYDADSDNFNGYLNGSSSASFTATDADFDTLDNNASDNGPVGSWGIGGEWNHDDGINGDDYLNPFEGSIGIVRYYNKVLSSAEIEQNYDAEKSRYGH